MGRRPRAGGGVSDIVSFGIEGGGTAAVIPPYGEDPVRPVSEYCAAFEQWFDVLVELAEANPAPENEWDRFAALRRIAAVVPDLRLAIRKSNYLWRRIYKGEPHRTEPCPVHKGHWSGCTYTEVHCGCQSDVNVTGWLPPKEATS